VLLHLTIIINVIIICCYLLLPAYFLALSATICYYLQLPYVIHYFMLLFPIIWCFLLFSPILLESPGIIYDHLYCLLLSVITGHYLPLFIIRYYCCHFLYLHLLLCTIICYDLLLADIFINTKSMPPHQEEHAYTSAAPRRHSNDQVLAETVFCQTSYRQPTRKPTRNTPTRIPFPKVWGE
jgi:hypothetical protein